ncbi:glycosyltransferase [Pseudomonas sp. D(2018)]|uniref:glycosyltransferase n=1 Tax=Pseudomonas sp. D(2018) TaxID=2502238 RepID=UPI0021144F27|nr:glycosyltransferase [Pseudomonas sp. D(2018)]
MAQDGFCGSTMNTLILIGSKINQDSIQHSLGKPEYSYFFLMKEFIPALQRLGTVVEVKNLDEVDALYDLHSAQGRKVIFLSFSPPQQTPLGLRCPTVPVFAWEFDSIPDEPWGGDPRNDWRYVFERIQGCIATSSEAADLVRAATQGRLPVLAAPAPVWERFGENECHQGLLPRQSPRHFSFPGVIIDSPILGLSADGLVRKIEPAAAPEPVVEAVAQPEMEQVSEPAVVSRWAEYRRISQVLFSDWWLEFTGRPRKVEEPVAIVAPPPVAVAATNLQVEGVVYTTVLNPADGRKNWIDLITAFCWAFRDEPGATLVVKMTHHNLEHYRVVLMTLLSRLAPFSCRVVVLHGFLEDDQYRQLVDASDYYVNASSCEGLCLPLMEFLCAGKPALAPRHTAMADYLDSSLAFLVRGALEPTCWPHDPTGMLSSHRYRLDWQSLMEAFRASYALARDDARGYQKLSAAALRRMKAFCAFMPVTDALGAFFEQVVDDSRGVETRVRSVAR